VGVGVILRRCNKTETGHRSVTLSYFRDETKPPVYPISSPSLLAVRYLAIFRAAADAWLSAAWRDLDNNHPKSVMREFPSGPARGGHLSRHVQATTLTRADAGRKTCAQTLPRRLVHFTELNENPFYPPR